MKKIYVDEILHKGDKSQPGPGKYTTKDSFGEKKGYTMSARFPTERLALEKSGKLPGPGSYTQDNYIGKVMMNSMYKTTNNFSISKEKRFEVPTKKTE